MFFNYQRTTQVRLCTGRSLKAVKDTNVFVVGDGKLPLTAACLCEFLPNDSWKFFSIDPIMTTSDKDNITTFSKNLLHTYALYSQQFSIPTELQKAGVSNWEHYDLLCAPIICSDDADDLRLSDHPDSGSGKPPLSIVVACHSHAPLREFWERVPRPKIAVTLPCCERFSDLGRRPCFQYDDFEIFTPKRRIRIYGEM